MSEPAIAVSQDGLGRRREEIEKSPMRREGLLGPAVLPSAARPALPRVTLRLLLPRGLGCPWLNLAAGFLWLSRVLGPS